MFRQAVSLTFALLAIGGPLKVAGADEPLPAATEALATSIRAGFVNLFEGQVAITKEDEGVPAEGYALNDGERLRTEEGRAELTLTPGSFLRVGPRSELEMIHGGIQSATFRLHRGEVVADVSGPISGQPSVIEVAGASFRFEKAGLYRVALEDEGAVSLDVFDGRVSVNDGFTTVTKGQSIVIEATGTHERGRAAGVRDKPLVAWSRQRRKLMRRRNYPQPHKPGPESVVDREVRHMETNRPVGTVVVGP